MTTPTPKDAVPFDPPVFCSGIERDCKHGQLARSCHICELERELAAARAELARERERNCGPVPKSPLRDLGGWLAHHLDEDKWATCEAEFLNPALAFLAQERERAERAEQKLADERAMHGLTLSRAERAEARAEANAKDAERYRWLRGNKPDYRGLVAVINLRDNTDAWLSGEYLDKAIDAAIAGDKP